MAQHDRKTKARAAGKQRRGRASPGSHGERGSQGERYQDKDMGAHPAYGKQVRASRGKEEDYGSRGLHRRAGTIKHEGFENRGTGHAEDYDARYEAAAFKGKDEARRGRKVMMNQTIREREAAARRKRAGDAKVRSHGFSEVRGQPDEEDLDVSPGAAGGSKRSKQDPTTG